MFPFIGIMADQEPKRAFTPSGSYSMGLFESGDSVDVTADITGTSDFTFMIWAYPTTANQYIFKTSDNTAYLQIKSDGKLRCQILNTNLTNSVVESASAISLNTMQMITVTGNTTNGLKLYINDVLNNSGSMPANNNVAGKTWQLGTNFDGSLALFRSWSKELALADVEAHYAYDENLLLQGGVAVSAMTTDQKTDLEFAIEVIQDVPYDSDEFDDRSTNKYAVTNNGVTLLGQSLQVYTDASDLPSLAPNAFSVRTATLDGSTQYYNSSSNVDFSSYSSLTVNIFVNNVNVSSTESLISAWNSSGTRIFYMELLTGNTIAVGIRGSSSSYSTSAVSLVGGSGWRMLSLVWDGSDLTLYENGVSLGSTSAPSFNNSSQAVYIGNQQSTSLHYEGSVGFAEISDNAYSSTYLQEIYNNGTPLCYGDRSITPTAFWNLSTFNGRAESTAIVDKAGSNDLTATGSPTYEDTGALIVSDGGVQYNTAFATLDGSTQYLESTNSSNYNFGTDSVFVSGWIKASEAHRLYFKGNETGTGNQDLFISAEVLSSREIVFDLSVNNSNRRQWTTTTTPIPDDNSWHHIAIYHARTDDTTQPVSWVDGVSQGAIPQSYTTGSGWASANFTQTQPMKLGINAITPIYYADGVGAFVNTIKGYSPTQSDIDELYNEGTPKSYADIDSTLKARFMSFIDCGTYNGRTESEAITEYVETETFNNVNSAPLESELAVECNEAVYVPVYSIYYRIHDQSSSFDPNVTITQGAGLTYTHTQGSYGQSLTLIHVSKVDVDGKKLFWDVEPSGYTGGSTTTLHNFGLADGHLLGSDISFVNGSAYVVPTVLDSRNANQTSRHSNSLTVPDLSSFGEDITIIVSLRKSHEENPAGQVHTIYGVELRETNEGLITSYDLVSQPYAQTGTDGASSYGSLYEAPV